MFNKIFQGIVITQIRIIYNPFLKFATNNTLQIFYNWDFVIQRVLRGNFETSQTVVLKEETKLKEMKDFGIILNLTQNVLLLQLKYSNIRSVLLRNHKIFKLEVCVEML